MESPGSGLRGADVPWLGDSLPPAAPCIGGGTNAPVSAERQSLAPCRPVAMATLVEVSRRGMCWQAARRREDTGKNHVSPPGSWDGLRQHRRAERRGDAVVESCSAFSSVGGVKSALAVLDAGMRHCSGVGAKLGAGCYKGRGDFVVSGGNAPAALDKPQGWRGLLLLAGLISGMT